MDYKETLNYLYGLLDYEKQRIERYVPETLDLGRIEALLAVLDNPQRTYPSVHLAGTKGKGSTAALVESVLRAAGYRTGLYTSPHLHTYCERIQVLRQPIPRGDLTALVDELRPHIEAVPGVTTFEATTALAFMYFARQAVDFAVIEVGLGGRLDATNVLLPEVAVITSLSLDHTYLLGDTLAQIAAEKGGIIKPHIPVVVADQQDGATAVLREIARERQAPLTVVAEDWTYALGEIDLHGQTFEARCRRDPACPLAGTYRIPLLGRYQVENAVAALAVLEVLRRKGRAITPEAVREGLASVRWPGRLELLSRRPLVVLDCAHNPYSVRRLVEALGEWFPDRRWSLVFGSSSDKDVPGMLRELLPVADRVFVTRTVHPRATAPMTLADMVAAQGGSAEVAVETRKALQRALETLDDDHGLLVTGSVFLVAEAEHAWAGLNSKPLPENDWS